ncbi:MAG: TIR domain-containing protein [Bacteroidetes bacterium]|nr:TIR domain-containing protein [Bacteroidota bacterium]
MPELKTYDLFISHAWSHGDEYYSLVEKLIEAPNFKWRNYSVPEHDPLIDPENPEGMKKLEKMLAEQVRQASCVIIIGGMYVNHREWIQKEIKIAQDFEKPIVLVSPWAQERIPKEIQGIADEVVKWNIASIIEAIRKCLS